MKFPISRSILSIAFLLPFSTSWAGATTYSQSSQYCFFQTQVRGDYSHLIIEHNLIVPEEHAFMRGDIFVAVRELDSPDSLWLLDGVAWHLVQEPNDILEAQYKDFERLPAVVPIAIFEQPVDISEIVSDIEILVGYGLRIESESVVESFEEMLSSRRYNSIWSTPANRQYPVLGLPLDTTICLTTNEVTYSLIGGRPDIGTTGDEVDLAPPK